MSPRRLFFLPLALGMLWVARGAAEEPALRPSTARECAVCHVRWDPGFDRPAAIVLIDRPAGALASEEQTCLGCHDGSVADSRREVWVEHSHRTGVSPPPGMKVPLTLPLADGKITCRTCHTAHAGTRSDVLAGAVFLRVRNDASQLCQMCHADHAKGPELGTHPIGGMPWPLPQTLIAAGAKPGPDVRRLFCQTCHTPHGAREDHLLVMGTQSNQLCLTCHEKLRPGMWRPDVAREHPQNPRLSSDAQRRAIVEMGTKAGPGETLVCLSCHKLHHGKAGRAMLADTLHDSRLCLRCHPGRERLFGTTHDLRISAPDERNRLGRTAEESGPCGACHSFHQYARRPDPQPLDPTGLCATCHQSGRCAENASGLPFRHPDVTGAGTLVGSDGVTLFPRPGNKAEKTLACLSCHDPHDTEHPHFLRHAPERVCASCHPDHSGSLAGAHDFTDHAGLKNGRGRAGSETGRCGFCHGVHDSNGPFLWTATATPPKQPDELCTACHRQGGLATDKVPGVLVHPSGSETAEPARALACRLPLFDATGHQASDGFVTCSSCHNPHGGRGGLAHLLRDGSGPASGVMCVACHADVGSIQSSMHSERVLRDRAATDGVSWATASCRPCHAVHTRPGETVAGTWAGPLGPTGHPLDARRCLGCHGPGGAATEVTVADHPAVPLQNITSPDAVGFLPLRNDQGLVDPTGHITCLTCHLPHGRILDPQPRTADSAAMIRDQLRARMPMLRAFVPPNLCSTCHGFDGLRRFLYYHNPDKRGGRKQMLQTGSDPHE